MSDKFNWLHLSDLHFGQKMQGPLWANVRDAFFDDLERLHARCGPWNAIFFTGDLVYSGTAEQFKRFEDDVLMRLNEKLVELGSSDVVLLAVPGNHDLIRPDTKGRISSSLRILLQPGGIQEIAEEFWSETDTEYDVVINKSIGEYENWWSNTPWRKGALIQDRKSVV